MLVLSRKSQEQIRVGDDIIISVLKIKSNVVQIGIKAPREVSILRAELPVFGDDDETTEPDSPKECAATTDDDPEFAVESEPSLQSYLRLLRRRRGGYQRLELGLKG